MSRALLILACLVSACGGVDPDAATLFADSPRACPLGDDCGSPGPFTIAPADAGALVSPADARALDVDLSPSRVYPEDTDGGAP